VFENANLRVKDAGREHYVGLSAYFPFFFLFLPSLLFSFFSSFFLLF